MLEKIPEIVNLIICVQKKSHAALGHQAEKNKQTKPPTPKKPLQLGSYGESEWTQSKRWGKEKGSASSVPSLDIRFLN